MKNLTDKQREFLVNGFYIERNVFDTKDMEEIFINFYDICFNIALKYNIKHNKTCFCLNKCRGVCGHHN